MKKNKKLKNLRDKKGRFLKGGLQDTNKNGKVGRKLFDGKDEKIVILKLEQAFVIGATDEEACFYADISEPALYSYQNKHPEFQERKRRLKMTPILQARQTLISDLKTNPENAKWYLIKKARDEFGDTQVIEHKGSINFSQEAEKRAKKYDK